ncbi:GDSL-type esterase/lipase family protein [Mucilaginibacter calamicampi]|uniref:GDSL-type esterase/lipase family protein n=1 Tax=Mucilaginibacter calamicampi TaxID=1302352 RepID=A0ABW2Z148_9SPHI
MKKHFLLALLISLACCGVYAQQTFPFANEVKQFQHQDSLNFPKPGGTLFIGSSSIRRWTDMEQRFPGAPLINRGLGGTEIGQWVSYYVPYVVTPYKPAKIFIYVGDNDLAKGKTAQYVADQFSLLWQMIREKLPDAAIYFMAIKKSPARWQAYDKVDMANQIIKAITTTKTKTYFVDTATPILKAGTTLPDSALFVQDMVHFNSKGYDKWEALLKPLLK